MINVENVLDISRYVIPKIAPLEESVFSHFDEYYREDPKRLEFNRQKNQRADLGFGIGNTPTFLTPWIIYAVKEGINLIRDIFAGIIIDRATTQNQAIPKEALNSTLLRQMKRQVYEALHSQGLKGRKGREISDTVIDTLLNDPKASSALFAILIIDAVDKN